MNAWLLNEWMNECTCESRRPSNNVRIWMNKWMNEVMYIVPVSLEDCLPNYRAVSEYEWINECTMYIVHCNRVNESSSVKIRMDKWMNEWMYIVHCNRVNEWITIERVNEWMYLWV